MPLITALHLFAFSAAIRPGNAVFSGFDAAPQVFASALAMSTSKPMIFPLVVVYSIGGNVGSVQNVNVVACPPAPAPPAAARARDATAAEMNVLRMPPPRLLLGVG